MVLDHAGKAFPSFFMGNDLLFLMGRLAFPLFAIAFALDYRAANTIKFPLNLWKVAIISQPVYAFVMGVEIWSLNILFLFAGVITALYLLKNTKTFVNTKAIAYFSAIGLCATPSSYGFFGLLLFGVLLYSPTLFRDGKAPFSVIFLAAVVTCWGAISELVMCNDIRALILVVIVAILLEVVQLVSLLSNAPTANRTKVKHLWMRLYAGHLAVLWMMQVVIAQV